VVVLSLPGVKKAEQLAKKGATYTNNHRGVGQVAYEGLKLPPGARAPGDPILQKSLQPLKLDRRQAQLE
jgi:hypothetical protein